MRIEDMPANDVAEIKRRLVEQINSMGEAELKIQTRTRESLGTFIAEAVHAIAFALGYLIAMPIAWSMRFAEEIGHGLTTGFREGMDSARRR